jgi:hypothetical protein
LANQIVPKSSSDRNIGHAHPQEPEIPAPPIPSVGAALERY